MQPRPPHVLATGLSLFAMFFGAGNVIFPLFVGLNAGSMLPLSLAGLLITSVALPLMALIAMVQVRGQHHAYFDLGNWGTKILLFLCLFLLGPFLVVPRTITVAHAAISQTISPIPLPWFSLSYCLFIGLLSFNARRLLSALGRVFTPLMLILLAAIILYGLFSPPSDFTQPALSLQNAFSLGLKEGYFTLDVLAAIVFGQFTYVHLRQQATQLPNELFKKHLISAAWITGGLLSAVYIGLAYVSARHGQLEMLQAENKNALLVLLTFEILPSYWSGIAGLIIASACITTACALSKIFADYMHHFFRHRHIPLSEIHCLGITLLITFIMSLLGFNRLMDVFAPLVIACYPVFIFLTFAVFFPKKLSAKVRFACILLCAALGLMSVYGF